MSSEPTERELAELLEEVRRIDVQAKRLVKDVMAGGYSSVFRGSGMDVRIGVVAVVASTKAASMAIAVNIPGCQHPAYTAGISS